MQVMSLQSSLSPNLHAGQVIGLQGSRRAKLVVSDNTHVS